MRTRHANRLLIVAILIISTAPLFAQRQQQDVAKLKADARNLVGVIGSDKTRTQTYCQILDLTAQLARANREKDSKKTKALSQKMDQVQKSLGPEFVALVKGLNRIDLNSPDGREIALIIQSLNQSCPD
jgi:ABC-type transporter Mla subunit MlaD